MAKLENWDGWKVLKPVKAKKVTDGGIHLPDGHEDAIYIGKDSDGSYGYVQGREFDYDGETYHAVENKHIVFEIKDK